MIDRCPRVIHWWDIDTDSRCTRDSGHEGDHTDGDRWWDGHGLRTPRDEPPPAPTPAGRTISTRPRDPRARLTDAEAVEIRRRYDAGWTKMAISRDLDVRYSTVWQIVNRHTYRNAS